MPAPLVPPQVDLRDFPFMQLDVKRLRDCNFTATASAEGFRAAVLLWCACWHQRPAASLPDDNRILATLAGFGRDLSTWMTVRDEALYGFVLCDDGRYYHPLIAEKAVSAWKAKLSQRERTAAARAAKLARATDRACGAASNSSAAHSEKEPATSSVSVPETGASSPAPRKASRPRPRSQIAEDAQPTSKDRAAAQAAGLDDRQFRSEWQKFRDHHRAKGSLMADWSAAWRTWLGNVAQFQPRAGPRSRGQINPFLDDFQREQLEQQKNDDHACDLNFCQDGDGSVEIVDLADDEYSRVAS